MGQRLIRALIVDDEPPIRELTSRALSAYQFACDEAQDGNEAMALCQANNYDVVIADLKMPNRHGHSLICELLEWHQRPRIFVMTGLSEPRLARELVLRGVDDVLQKPIAYDDLAVKLIAAISPEASSWSQPPSTVSMAVDRLTGLRRVEQHIATLSDLFEETLEGLFDCDHYLAPPPKAVKDFINRLVIEEGDAPTEETLRYHEIRKNPRLAIQIAATAVPVDEEFRAIGEPFQLTLRDISQGGVCMLHTRSIPEQFLALSWPAETLPYRTLHVVARVTRCCSLSRFYDIGGQFCTGPL